ncbi:hypothetical protein SAMN04489860_0231 [Paraoerskovia marina]|uniref:Pirin n=1 Tax=Paraoerskovia marina TaxID=545619 RepID=A0A1H1MG26_9CELL|nr:pirin family protein [Paraoerskovia marina]SDR85774.1 hypothetical protein SAMN04489860_0231 [Paraoerskovia marina]
MTNLEARPDTETCAAGSHPPGVEILAAREVPLGGPRAMSVRRTIPQRRRSLVGAWCFADHYGPSDVSLSAGMQVPPHPHTGLQTVTWLFEGEIEHRDSLGSLQRVRPGELNLMTAGFGISHSEASPATRPDTLHGVQLWTALPGHALDVGPSFEHHADLPAIEVDGARVQVMIGSLGVHGQRLASAATAFTPLVGAQIDLAPGATVDLEVDVDHEHGLLVDAGDAGLAGTAVPVGALGYVAPGHPTLRVTAGPDAPVRAVLIGGEPFDEEIVMWWNFVGRSHEDVARARADWERGGPDGRFGHVEGFPAPALPAPSIPDVRLRPRRRPSTP